jgi:hypothetical protein
MAKLSLVRLHPAIDRTAVPAEIGNDQSEYQFLHSLSDTTEIPRRRKRWAQHQQSVIRNPPFTV